MFERGRLHVWQFLLLLAVFLWFAMPLLAQSRMTVRRDVHHDVSLPLRVMIAHAPRSSRIKREAEPVRQIPLPPGLTRLEEDPLRQMTTVALTPAVSSSFEGLGNGQYGFSVTGAPPDTNGAVGATQYVQWVNTSFAIFNKSTGGLVSGPAAGNTLWSGFGGGCQTNNDGDPIVLYDKLSNRWVFSQFSVSTTPYLQCIAVSTTSDATGTYNRYSFQYNNFDDYPKMGVWSDAYYETFNMFNGNSFVGADACAYDRTAMLNGSSATQVCFQQNSSVGGLLPADIDGTTTPPSGSPNYMLYFGTNSLNLFKFHVDFSTPTNSTFTGPTTISVAAFTPLCNGGTCVPQPGTSNQLDSLADRLMYRLAYRNFGTRESLVVNHSVATSSSGGIRWYEIQNPSGTPTLAQQGTYAPDSNYRWMGSIAMDKSGDIAVGYSVSNASNVFPTIAYAGRLSTDPAGTLGSEITVVSGTGSQTGTLTRWGDYSAMQVDPSDDCTFWYTTEYMKTNGTFNWNTRIANFKFSGCGSSGGPAASLSPTSLTFGNQTVNTTSAPQTVTLSNSGTSALSITSITTSGDFAQTNNCGTSLAAGANCTINVTFTPTTTGTRTGTLTVNDNASTSPQTASLSGTGVASSNCVPGTLTNGNFEAGSLSCWTSTGVTGVVSPGHTGNYAARVGSTSPSTDSSIAQSFNAPSSGGVLSFWYKVVCPDTVTYDWATATLQDNTAGTTTTVLGKTCTNNNTWVQVSANLTGGHSYTVTLSNHDDNYPGDPTYTLYDDVVVTATQQLVQNGGFETGNLTNWTTGGVFSPVVSTTQKHSGNYSAKLGASSGTEPNGDSSIYQTITIPSTATSATLSFWYWPFTQDTITYDWQEAQVQNTSGSTLASIMKVDSNAQAWTNVTYDLTSYKGQTIRLYFNVHGDGYGDYTYMYLDDVTVAVK